MPPRRKGSMGGKHMMPSMRKYKPAAKKTPPPRKRGR